MISTTLRNALAASLALGTATTAVAAPGDIVRIAGADVVNLRAGPSDQANIRGRVENGDDAIELSRQGSWVGLRVLQTGEEGWIFGDLLQTVSRSGLQGGTSGAVESSDAGFLQLSESFDALIRGINAQMGFSMIETVEQSGEGALRVVPTAQWLLDSSRDAHLMTSAAIYQMWKNHQNSAPVRVVMTDSTGEDYITINDEASGPSLSIVH